MKKPKLKEPNLIGNLFKDAQLARDMPEPEVKTLRLWNPCF